MPQEYIEIRPHPDRTVAWAPKLLPLQRNLRVSDTLEWRPEARLAQPANPMRESAASASSVRSQLPFEPGCPLR
jgi:hypothetical protein